MKKTFLTVACTCAIISISQASCLFQYPGSPKVNLSKSCEDSGVTYSTSNSTVKIHVPDDTGYRMKDTYDNGNGATNSHTYDTRTNTGASKVTQNDGYKTYEYEDKYWHKTDVNCFKK